MVYQRVSFDAPPCWLGEKPGVVQCEKLLRHTSMMVASQLVNGNEPSRRTTFFYSKWISANEALIVSIFEFPEPD